jgi:tetratricopeptide (TPR) repeat protein
MAVLLPAFVLSVGAQERYAVEGRVTPAAVASVSLHGATTPFAVSTLSDGSGRFRFRRIEAGTYTLNVFVPGRGEMRRTLVVSAGHADGRGRIAVTVAMEEAAVDREAATTVSVRALAVPERARREYQEAQKKLERRDVAGAETHLRRAVEMAPRFADAWNYLGTIAYQTQRYPEAEQLFRRALEADPDLYAPLVNLGGVLINLTQFEEAVLYNRHAVLRQPKDALAHSQLGMALLQTGKLEGAESSLREAIRLDAAHFSQPQLHLAEALLQQGKRAETAEVLEQFLSQHPDHEARGVIERRIQALRNPH